MDRQARRFSEAETGRLLRHLWSDLSVPFVPAPTKVILEGQDKLHQLCVAGALGFELPSTLVTNEPGAILDFWHEHRGRCVTKLIGSRSLEDAGMVGTFARFTEPVTHRDLGALSSARHVPSLIQAYVAKKLEIRVTVVGARVFAVEIDSQSAAHSRHDWRRRDPARNRQAVHLLPSVVAERCVTLTHRLGLRYGALDLILTPDDRYVFLEINPSGEYLWLEDSLGLPITASICDLLVSLARGQSDDLSD
jgi:glutathione synthase/RimK-type ligase-like ATP-grasp enzyme